MPETDNSAEKRGTIMEDNYSEEQLDEKFYKEKTITNDSIAEEVYEYQQGQSHISVKIRLKSNIQFWRNMGTSEFVLSIFENGCKITFLLHSEVKSLETKNPLWTIGVRT